MNRFHDKSFFLIPWNRNQFTWHSWSHVAPYVGEGIFSRLQMAGTYRLPCCCGMQQGANPITTSTNKCLCGEAASSRSSSQPRFFSQYHGWQQSWKTSDQYRYLLEKAKCLPLRVRREVCTGLTNLGSGEVMSWGTNTRGELGHPLGKSHFLTPTSVPISSFAYEVVSGKTHSLCLTGKRSFYKLAHCSAANGLWSWGSNLYGQLGTGQTSSSIPRPVKAFEGKVVSVMKCGNNHSGAVAGI